MRSREGLTLRQKALDALEKSTRMLQVAIDLLEQGNQMEADHLRKEAQFQRSISTLLMAEAHNIERIPMSTGSKLRTHASPHHTSRSGGH
jgi:hypothetical protein